MKNPLYISVVISFIASDVLFFGKGTSATKRYTEPKTYTLDLYEVARDCQGAVYDGCGTSNFSGDYLIKPDDYDDQPFKAYCDSSQNDGTAWTLIQRREVLDSTVTFNRSWEDYRLGFGLSPNDFWIGNEKLSYLTNQNTYQLRIDMTTSNGSSIHLTYDNFRISDEFSGYKILSTGKFNFSSEDGVIESCPHNMRYGYCVSQRICPDPDDSIPCRRNEESCFCPEEFQLNGDECVSPGICDDCFLEGTETEEGVTIESGGSYVYPNCSLNCSCVDGNVTCVNYMCSVNANCTVRNNAGQCNCNTDYVGDGTVCRYPINCMEIFDHDVMAKSDVYTIQPNNNSESTLEVLCDMSDGGGWTVFQRRFNGLQNFSLPEQNYSEGFGSLDGEFWLGNEILHSLTIQIQYELKIDFMDINKALYDAQYSSFQISNKTEKYALQLGNFTGGNAGDSLTTNSNRQPFLTDLTAAWQAVAVNQNSDDVTTVHSPTAYDYSVQHDEGNGNTDDEAIGNHDSLQESTEFLSISIGPWWHSQDDNMTIDCDLNGNYNDMFWFKIPRRIASTQMKIRPTKNEDTSN